MNISETVRDVVAESLFLDKDQVQLNSNLMRDLGAESIDFLDIIFRLEKFFSIKIPKGEIEKKARQDLSDAEFAVGGVLQPKALQRLAEVMPELDKNLLKDGLKLHDIPTLYTVATFVKLVEYHLTEKAAKENASVHAGDSASAAMA